MPWSCVGSLGVRDVGLGEGAERLRTRGCLGGRRRIPSSERRSPVLLFGRCLVAPLPHGLFNGLIWPKAGCASIVYAATPPGEFLPLGCAHSSRGKKLVRLASFALLRPASGCVVDRLRPSIAIEAAMGAGSKTEDHRRFIMANIGSFKKSGNEFHGEIATLSVQAKGVRIVPESNRASDNAPSHRIYVGRAVEIGAAWSKRSAENRDYLSVKLDDPSFNAPIYANLFDDEDGEGFTLIWTRGRKPNGD